VSLTTGSANGGGKDFPGESSPSLGMAMRSNDMPGLDWGDARGPPSRLAPAVQLFEPGPMRVAVRQLALHPATMLERRQEGQV
jgi:hypothetical protein